MSRVITIVKENRLFKQNIRLYKKGLNHHLQELLENESM